MFQQTNIFIPDLIAEHKRVAFIIMEKEWSLAFEELSALKFQFDRYERFINLTSTEFWMDFATLYGLNEHPEHRTAYLHLLADLPSVSGQRIIAVFAMGQCIDSGGKDVLRRMIMYDIPYADVPAPCEAALSVIHEYMVESMLSGITRLARGITRLARPEINTLFQTMIKERKLQ